MAAGTRLLVKVVVTLSFVDHVGRYCMAMVTPATVSGTERRAVVS